MLCVTRFTVAPWLHRGSLPLQSCSRSMAKVRPFPGKSAKVPLGMNLSKSTKVSEP